VAGTPVRVVRLKYELLLVTILWAIVFVTIWTGHRMIPFDSVEFYYPAAYFSATGLRSGDWPWWNPYVYSGFPQVADPQSMMFSPLLMALMMISERPSVVWFDICVVLHLLFGAWGVVFLAKAYKFAPVGTILAALVFMVGGAVAARLQHTTMILAYAYLPWVLLCCHRFAERPTFGFAAALGLSIGALITSLVQPTLLFVLFAGCYFLVRVSVSKPPARRILLGLGVAVLIAIAIAGLQVATTLAVLPLSTRGAFSFDDIAKYSVSPGAFLTFVWPNALGSLRGDYTGSQDVSETYFYFGAIPLFIMMLFLGRSIKERAYRIDKICFIAGALFAVVYVLGANTPIFRLLYEFLPGVRLFKRPSDAAFLLNFCLAMLVGFCATTAFGTGEERFAKRFAIACLMLTAVWLVVIGGLESLRGQQAGFIFLLALLAGVVAFGAMFAPSIWRGPIAVIGLVVISVADYRLFNLPNQLNGHGMNPAREIESPGRLVQAVRDELRRAPGLLPFRIEATGAGEFASTILAIHGIGSTQGYNPLRIRDYGEVFGSQESGNQIRPFTASLPSLSSPLFNLSGTRYVLTAEPIARLTNGNLNGQFELVASEGKLSLWRNRNALARLLTPTEARVMDVGQRSDVSQFVDMDFAKQVLLYPRDAEEEAQAKQLASTCKGRADVDRVSYENSSVKFRVRATEPAWIFISDLAFPGWRATADGQPLKIWRANGIYRAICVPAGEQEIRMAFSPLTFLSDTLGRKVFGGT